MKNRIKFGLILLFVFIFIIFQLTENVTDSFLLNLLFIVPPFIAACCGFKVFNQLHYSSARGKAFLFITLGMAFWALAELAWMMAVVFLDIKPFPSFVDILYFVAYPLLAIGLWLEYQMGEIRWTLKKAISLSIISIVLITLTGYFGVYYAFDSENAVLENVFNIFYGVGDVVLSMLSLLILAIVIEYKRGKFFRPWLVIFFANILMIVGDVLFSIYFNEYDLGIRLYRYMDFVWIASYLMYAYGLFRVGYILEEINREVAEKNLVS